MSESWEVARHKYSFFQGPYWEMVDKLVYGLGVAVDKKEAGLSRLRAPWWKRLRLWFG